MASFVGAVREAAVTEKTLREELRNVYKEEDR
jgi:hypothetical protein